MSPVYTEFTSRPVLIQGDYVAIISPNGTLPYGRVSAQLCQLCGFRLDRYYAGGGGGASGKAIPCIASQSSVGIISIASHGHPSRNAPSGPLLMHFWQPMQR